MFKNVLIKFGSPFCQPCKNADRYLAKYPPTQHASVDVTEETELAQQYGIRQVPTFIRFDADGKEVERFNGFTPKQVDEAIAKI